MDFDILVGVGWPRVSRLDSRVSRYCTKIVGVDESRRSLMKLTATFSRDTRVAPLWSSSCLPPLLFVAGNCLAVVVSSLLPQNWTRMSSRRVTRSSARKAAAHSKGKGKSKGKATSRSVTRSSSRRRRSTRSSGRQLNFEDQGEDEEKEEEEEEEEEGENGSRSSSESRWATVRRHFKSPKAWRNSKPLTPSHAHETRHNVSFVSNLYRTGIGSKITLFPSLPEHRLICIPLQTVGVRATRGVLTLTTFHFQQKHVLN